MYRCQIIGFVKLEYLARIRISVYRLYEAWQITSIRIMNFWRIPRRLVLATSPMSRGRSLVRERAVAGKIFKHFRSTFIIDHQSNAIDNDFIHAREILLPYFSCRSSAVPWRDGWRTFFTSLGGKRVSNEPLNNGHSFAVHRCKRGWFNVSN